MLAVQEFALGGEFEEARTGFVRPSGVGERRVFRQAVRQAIEGLAVRLAPRFTQRGQLVDELFRVPRHLRRHHTPVRALDHAPQGDREVVRDGRLDALNRTLKVSR